VALRAKAFTGWWTVRRVARQTTSQDGPFGILPLPYGALPHAERREDLNLLGVIDDAAAYRPPPEVRVAARPVVR